MKKIPVIIADESSIIRNSLTGMLAKNSFLEIKEKSSSAEETLEKLNKLKKAVIIADPLLPGMDLDKFPAILKERYPDAVLIVCSHAYDHTCMQQLKNKNIHGYLTKKTTAGEIEAAARAALEKKTFTGKDVNENIAAQHLYNDTAAEKTKADLTEREKEVMHWMIRAKTIEEMAEILFIATATVYKHSQKVLEKTKHENEAKLIMDAIQKRIITLEEIKKLKLK